MNHSKPTVSLNDLLRQAAVLFRDLQLFAQQPHVRFIALVVCGIAGWWLAYRGYPLERVVPRYAEF